MKSRPHDLPPQSSADAPVSTDTFGEGRAEATALRAPRGANFRARFDALKQKPWWKPETAMVAGAIVAGLTSAALSNANQAAQREQITRQFARTTVLVAARDLPAGTKIDPTALKPGERLSDGVTENFVPATDDMLAVLMNKSTGIDMKAGDPILLSAVQGASDASRLAEKIPPGKRLFTLTIGAKAAGYGWIRPNDHVDIIANIVLPDRGNTTFTVLEDVTLVSVGASTIIDGDRKATGTDVSFFISPDDFEALSFAQQKGTFTLALRNPKDVGTPRQGAKGVDLNGFLDHRAISGASGGGALQVTEAGKPVAPAKPKGG
jgi:Flp pilus assembly protein CpaB